ncbi:hypothetical protein A9995_13650 [Erythrobacter sp. QSSC1-22B]|uniref:ABC transporter permease n=1 Tax=Erythrobacter sp. QSSC1-22B TaxID=1860125 RepID=UPI000805FFD1|nr:DUF3526 domain-containing protein [Erythrobacter sp. QSSC1-22B]OBX17984.1 hypothetical protein A9995_13650 [Erythrobacter sp. QSSC1-22B]
MIASIIRKEFAEFHRDRRLRLVGLAMIVLALAALAVSALAQARYAAERETAMAADRAIWIGQGAINPHLAAHMGQYAFKPRLPLAAFDPGLTPWMGEAVWIEAHYQNPPQARPAETSSLIQRFGDLSPAWILQALLPLLIIMSGFAAVAGERDRGSLKLQLVQGARALPLLAGKAANLMFGAAVVVTSLVVLTSIASASASSTVSSLDIAVRWMGAVAIYLCYAAIWVGLTVGVSAIASSARQALLILLCVWAVCIVLIPRLAAEHASTVYPVPTAGVFWEKVRLAREGGIDGHNPGDERAATLMEQVLAQYGVSSLEELPVDFAGISLQAGEEYGNLVYDRLYGELQAQENRQVAAQRWYAPVSPLISIKTLSMGLAGTDLVHQQSFTHAAEGHRRDIQRLLNAEQTRTGKGQNNRNTAPPGFWDTVQTFSYVPPAIKGILDRYVMDIVLLLLWVAGTGMFLLFAANRLEKRA